MLKKSSQVKIKSMLTTFFNFLLNITADLGYIGIVILMSIESSFIPLPSEIVIPPAAYLASIGEMNIFIIIIAGVIGSIIGATFNYILSFYLGRPIIYKMANHKFAKFLFINPEKIMSAEKYFLNNSSSATFIGRLIPVVRHLISIPAGFSKMPFKKFILYTTLGSFVWVSILAGLGYFIGTNKDLLVKYYKEISYVLLILGAIWIIYKIYKIKFKK